MIAEGYTIRSFLHKAACMPREDWYAFDAKEGVGAVCDGVTRDPALRLPYKKSFWGKLKTAINYERPSRAGIVSKLCAKTLCDYILYSNERSAESLWFAMLKANTFAYDKNCSFGLTPNSVDYLQNNYARCVAAAALVGKGEAHWTYLADCGVAVFDQRGTLLERTKDDGPSVHDKERWQHQELFGKRWEDPEARSIIRKYFVNKPKQKYSYGTLTGEDDVMPYVRIGTWEFNEHKHLLVYTDGAAEVLFKNDGDIDGTIATLIATKDWSGLKRFIARCIKSEGTLVRLSHYL